MIHMTDDADLGALLRRLRHTAGLSLDELAQASGVSVRAISDMERGRSRRPQSRTLALLADALKLSATDQNTLTATAFAPRNDTALPADTGDFVGRAA